MPGIGQAAAVGVPEARYGEAVHVFLVPDRGVNPDVDEVRRRVVEELGDLYEPRSFSVVDASRGPPSARSTRGRCVPSISPNRSWPEATPEQMGSFDPCPWSAPGRQSVCDRQNRSQAVRHGQNRTGEREGDKHVFREMKFEVLGPVRGWLGEKELDLGSPQQRAVLAMLLLARGRQVPIGVIIDGLWEGDMPKSAVGTVRTYVSRLRRLLVAGAAGSAGCVIISVGDGYALHLGSALLDLDQFEAELSDARVAWQRHEEARAAALLRSALGLWQGAALAGIPGPYAESRRVRLSELQLAAEQERLAMDIEAGEYVAAIAELRALLADHPFREGFGESLMLALYKAGRQADALSVYDSVRRGLRDELGVDPGPALRGMYQRILRADDGLMDVAGKHVVRMPGMRPRDRIVAEPIVA